MLNNKVMAVDTETTGLAKWDPKVRTTDVSWFTYLGKGGVIPADEFSTTRERLQARLIDPSWTKVFFNASFDLPFMAKAGFQVKGPIVDAMWMAKWTVPEERSHKLKHLARKFLKVDYREEIVMKAWLKEANKNRLKGSRKLVQGDAPDHIRIPYALVDAKYTLALAYFWEEHMNDHNLWRFMRMEMKLLRTTVLKMERHGIPIDAAYADKLRGVSQKRLDKIGNWLKNYTKNPTFNPNSHPQAAAAVYDGSFQPTRFSKKTGQPSVNALALLDAPNKIGKAICEYRSYGKTISTYLKHFIGDLDEDGRIRVNFNQGGTKTGRFSSSGPNMQNVPRPDEDNALGLLRACIRAEYGYRLLFIDYDQIELRLMAHFSQEPHMLQAIRDGKDLHSATCYAMFGLSEGDKDFKRYRYIAKTVNFLIGYGGGAQVLRDTVLLQTKGEVRLGDYEAQEIITKYHDTHPYMMALFKAVAHECEDTGGVVNHYGRFVPCDPRLAYAAVNYKVQGTAADFLKLKMFKVNDYLKSTNTALIMQVHDELVFHWHKSDRNMVGGLVDLMEDRTSFSVPITASPEHSKNWLKKKPLILAA